MPPNTSTLEMLRNIVSVTPIPDGTQGTCIWDESEHLRFFLAMLRGSSDSAEFQPRLSPATVNRNTESGYVLGITFSCSRINDQPSFPAFLDIFQNQDLASA
jgi:hypothetical protein